ncbi:hypothetical protein Gotur_020116, partial [Gossypium turneri]
MFSACLEYDSRNPYGLEHGRVTARVVHRTVCPDRDSWDKELEEGPSQTVWDQGSLSVKCYAHRKELGEIIKLCRGLQQRDPVGRYLFLICNEGFFAIFRLARREGTLKETRITRGGLGLCHLHFEDYSIIFGEASVRGALVGKEISHAYELCSSQNLGLGALPISIDTLESLRWWGPIVGLGMKIKGQFFWPVEKHFYTQKCFWVKSNEEQSSFGASRPTFLKYFWLDEKAEIFCFSGQKVLLTCSFTFLACYTQTGSLLSSLLSSLLLCSSAASLILYWCWSFVPLLVLVLCSSAPLLIASSITSLHFDFPL